MSSQAGKGSTTPAKASSPRPGSPPPKGFVVLLGIEGSDSDEVVRSLVQLRREKGWSSRLFTLHSLRGADGLYEDWCERMSSDVRRLKIASSQGWKKTFFIETLFFFQSVFFQPTLVLPQFLPVQKMAVL